MKILGLISILAMLGAACGSNSQSSNVAGRGPDSSFYSYKNYADDCSSFEELSLEVSPYGILMTHRGFNPKKVSLTYPSRALTITQPSYSPMGGAGESTQTLKCGDAGFQAAFANLQGLVAKMAAGGTKCDLTQEPQKDLESVSAVLESIGQCK
jgi:hypothetical protein